MDATDLTLRDVYRARRRIQSIARRTPLVAAPALSARLGSPVHLKDETQQPTGAFKVRGAANRLMAMSQAQRERGVVAVSTGNHGRAVAFVGRELGVPVTVCVSTKVPENKREAIRALGARLEVHGDSQDEAETEGKRLVDAEGLAYVPPFDDPEIVAGQGTIGVEILEDLPEVRTVVVPLSGGGLAGGIALALKHADPGIRVIGVSMTEGAAMHASLAAGTSVAMPEAPTLADSLQGGIGAPNAVTLALMQQYLDDAILVSEEEIAHAMRFAFHEHRLVLEGGGAVAIAAVLARRVEPPTQGGGGTVLIASGGNVAMPAFLDIVGTKGGL